MLKEKQLLMEFIDWYNKLTPVDRVSKYSKNGEYNGLFNLDNEQLVDKFLHKKVNGR